jgi:mannose-6-phosphate isomerase-like protein (cupin superfamily)
MKSLRVGLVGALLLVLAISSKVEAFVFPEIEPDPDAPSYLFFDGQPFTFVKRGETTNGEFTLRETIVPPGKGAPPHFHTDDNEWLYVEEGTLRITLGENDYTDTSLIPGVNAPRDILHAYDAPAGTLVWAPPFRNHGVLNPTDTPAKLKVIWAPAGFERIFLEPGIIPVPDLSNVPTAPPNYAQTYGQAAFKFGVVSSTFEEQFGDIVFDDYIINQDNRGDELLQIVERGTKPVPEPSLLGGILILGTSGTISIWKRKRKSLNKVA